LFCAVCYHDLLVNIHAFSIPNLVLCWCRSNSAQLRLIWFIIFYLDLILLYFSILLF
jgi:hypothetical protein